MPSHVGIILDGNRRWAKDNGLSALDGHRRGAEVFKEIALGAFRSGISYLSAFVFSTENWQRTEEEVSYLMKLITKAVEQYLKEFDAAGIKITVAGQRDGLSGSVLKSIEKTEARTSSNQNGNLILCLNYGGQQEIVDAVKQIIDKNLRAEDVTTAVVEQNIYLPGVPAVDLLIRTSGEQRTSGFMMWRSAYAELLFIDKYWPDFTVQDFDEALSEYSRRQRRFGS